jgi:hypothetical protein
MSIDALDPEKKHEKNKAPRPLSDGEKSRLEEFVDGIHYSNR